MRLEYNQHHELFIRAKVDEALYAAGLLRRDEVHRDADTSNRFDFFRSARDFLRLADQELPPADQRAITIQRALGSSDFPNLLNAIVGKALVLGYQRADTTWRLFCAIRTVRDFREYLALRGASVGMPPLAPEYSEITRGSLLDEGAESGAVEAYTQDFGISREALANGDLEQIALTPYAFGQAIDRRINTQVFALLTSNPVLSDGVACFHADHGNLISSGSGAAPSITTLDEAASTMGAQVNAAGEPMNARPYCLLAPHSMATTLSVLRNAVNSTDPSDPSTGRLITATDSALSGTAWYGVANPVSHPGIAVVVRTGTEDDIRLEQIRTPIGRDGKYWRCGYDFDVTIADPKALFRNDGS